jgi:2-methylisoborneol synthase
MSAPATFEVALRRLPETLPSPELRRYLTGLHAWLGGSHEWHRSSGRYHAVTHA